MIRSFDSITRTPRPPAPEAPAVQELKNPFIRRVACLARYPLLACTLALIILPFLPELQFKITSVSEGVMPAKAADTQAQVSAGIKPGEWLIIPKINLNTEILEGANPNTVDKGIWREPAGSVPGQVGNTVLLGHRFEYTTKENYFYHLDKVSTGDIITIDWNGKAYNYTVIKTMVVPATDLSIELPTTRPTLTLYTCTPLLTGVDRFVVQAIPSA